MKIRLLLFTLICAVVAAPGVMAQDGKAKKKAPATVLGGHMQKMNDALRTLREQISDSSKNADSLMQVGIIRENATAALKLEPALKAEIPPADQGNFVMGFHDQLQVLLGAVGKLETALKANDNVAAAAELKEVGNAQKAGHTKYKKAKKKKAA